MVIILTTIRFYLWLFYIDYLNHAFIEIIDFLPRVLLKNQTILLQIAFIYHNFQSVSICYI